ncbi:hypothetical protein RND81_09G083500 [Saponaria officinalis]|uniref:TTF-type domain-containing protein n=1 Tax=Saponaria officinalis TaxID=3572 RepID=A0AAW1IJM7_SAPOF
MNNRNPKRLKNLFSFFKSNSPTNIGENAIPGNEHDENADESEVETEKDQHEIADTEEELEIEDDQDIDITSLERDPGKRRHIGSYPLNERDIIRRAYVVHGPCQPHLDNYPSTQCGAQGRRFCHKWFKEWTWLEYSLAKDKAYCFPCFLFDEYPSRHPIFTEVGFNGWKNVMSKQSGIVHHVGGIMSIHNASLHKWENLRNPSRHIENVINKLSSQELAKNRLRLIGTIEAVRLLAGQGCSFRGHDESVDSPNGGNFDAVLGSFKRMNNEVNKVVDNAPGNAKYTSPKIQKQIANILGNKVRAIIRSEIGDSKFSILVDEALDVSNKEQMAIILRFVDRGGLIRERFFKVISVGDTYSQTLKEEIGKVLAHYDLQDENIRGQGYDGANNMRGVHDVWQFFSTLTLIVNFVDSSAKRHSMLKIFREEEISDLIAVDTLETGKGKNQVCTLQRAGATRWGSHFRSISSLIKLFRATRATIDDLYINGVDKVQGEAKAVGKALKKFDFVFCLHMMHDIMRITDFLCQALQKKDLDILNAMHFLSITKEKLQSMRENGWDDLILKVGAFCCENDISMPDMPAPYKKGLRNCEKNITNAHYYRVNIFYSVIDFQLTELDSRFTESSLEILVLSASMDPRYCFRAFKREDVCKLALKYYPLDFSSYDRFALDLECEFFVADIDKDPRFTKITSILDLCRQMVDFGKTSFYPMIYRLICLILTLPISTATTERAFSSMNIIKNKLRNKMNDEFLDDLMVLYIERIYADNIKNQDVIAEFELGGPRRVKFS